MPRVRTKSPASNAFERIADPASEASQVEELADLTVELLETRYPEPARVLRGVHPKSHGCVSARFEVLPDLPPDLRVGLFATPGRKFRAWIRYSNASVRVGPDTDDEGKHGSRGMAVKVMDVGDETLLPDRAQVNQDFLMINQPSFAFANLDDYLKLTRVLAENDDDANNFFAPLIHFKEKGELPPGVSKEEFARLATSFGEIQKLQSTPVANPLEVQYFSAAPFLFGQERVMKFSARPRGELKPQVVPPNPPDDYLRVALQRTIESGTDVEFDFMVQVRRADEPDLEIENASAVWDETRFPFVPVARIHIPAPQRILDSPAGFELCERSVFSPWHSLPEHQPVGSINRLRKQVYLASAEHRGADDEEARAGRRRERGRRILELLKKKRAELKSRPIRSSRRALRF